MRRHPRTDFRRADRLAQRLIRGPDPAARAALERELQPYLQNLASDRRARGSPRDTRALVRAGQRGIDPALRCLRRRAVGGRLPPRHQRPGFGSYFAFFARGAMRRG